MVDQQVSSGWCERYNRQFEINHNLGINEKKLSKSNMALCGRKMKHQLNKGSLMDWFTTMYSHIVQPSL